MKVSIKLVLTIVTALLSTQIFAQQLIPFQARLTDGAGAVVADGVYAVNFNIYDTATAGTALWTESHATVSVVGGVVNVILGSITPLNDPNNNGDLSDAVTFYVTDGDRFIGVTIGAGQEMVPRHQLIPSFHAVTADDAAKLGGNLPSHFTALSQHNTDIATLDSKINTVLAGMISAFSTSCPTGWLLADGTSGTPDLRGRFLRGEPLSNTASLDFGGNDDAIAVAHSHSSGTLGTGASGVHTHSAMVNYFRPAGGGSDAYRNFSLKGGHGTQLYTSGGGGNHTHSVTGSTATSGTGGTNANIPKYYEVIYCVKQ